VGKLVGSVGGTEDLFILEYRLSGEQIVEQTLVVVVVVEDDTVEVDIRRGAVSSAASDIDVRGNVSFGIRL